MVQATNGITNLVRPQSMDDVVGLEHIKQRLHYDIKGCVELGEPFPSYIITGLAGGGKSTVAGIISILIGGDIHKCIGTELKSADDIYTIAQNVKDNDTVFIEEAHGLGKAAQIILLEWIENYKILGGGDMVDGDAPKVCFVFATTNPGKLRKPLRERCIGLQVGYYKVEALKKILDNAGKKFEMDLAADDEALTLLAQSSRGTPRIAILHRLTMLRRVMAVDKLPYNLETVKSSLEKNGVNQWGLEKNDVMYCEILEEKTRESQGRPISQKILAASTGLELDLLDLIEAYLFQIGAIKISSQGRSLTRFGYDLIGKLPTEITQVPRLLRSKEIDMDKLAELLEDEEVRRKGMKGIMGTLGLKYVSDNELLKRALLELGYTVQKKAGIIPL